MIYGIGLVLLATFFLVMAGLWVNTNYGKRAGFLYTTTILTLTSGLIFLFFPYGGQAHGHGHIFHLFGITLIVGFVLLGISVVLLVEFIYEIKQVKHDGVQNDFIHN